MSTTYSPLVPLVDKTSSPLQKTYVYAQQSLMQAVQQALRLHQRLYTFASGKYSGCKPSLAMTVTLNPNLAYKFVSLSKVQSFE